MQHCGKHDVVFSDGGECWCCDEAKLDTPEKKAAAYKNAKHLAKRTQNAPQGASQVPQFLAENLSDEQLDAFETALKARADRRAAAAKAPQEPELTPVN